MYLIITIFSLLFLSKSILLSYFYNNILMMLLFPLELSGLSLYNNGTTAELSTYFRWGLVGWLGLEKEKNIIDKILLNNYTSNEYIMILCWIIVFLLYQIYYVINEKLIKKNELNKWTYFSYNLKYAMINYTSLYLWNLNILINLNNNNFWFVFINLLIFNCITFWFPGLIFNFTYGEKLFLYRKKYDFLINELNLKYKYMIIILLALKSLLGIYLIFFNFYYIGSKYSLLFLLLIYSSIIWYKKIFLNKKIKNYVLKINFITLIIIILSIIEDYFSPFIEIFISKCCLILLQILLIIYTMYKNYKFNINRSEGLTLPIIENNI